MMVDLNLFYPNFSSHVYTSMSIAFDQHACVIDWVKQGCIMTLKRGSVCIAQVSVE
jgi:hypothetical protein